MYLSRLTLDPRSTQARRDLGDPYEMHRTLVRAFVTGSEETPPRFLWRLDMGRSAWSAPIVLVQTEAVANWAVLASLPNYLQGGPETKVVDLSSLIMSGGHYRFRLAANPTVTRNGKRIGIGGEEEQLAWLARQGERLGFQPIASVVIASEVMSTSLKKAPAPITVSRVCFDGLLAVKDADKVRQAVSQGIGPAKAFGCGMLTLACAG